MVHVGGKAGGERPSQGHAATVTEGGSNDRPSEEHGQDGRTRRSRDSCTHGDLETLSAASTVGGTSITMEGLPLDSKGGRRGLPNYIDLTQKREGSSDYDEGVLLCDDEPEIVLSALAHEAPGGRQDGEDLPRHEGAVDVDYQAASDEGGRHECGAHGHPLVP